MSFSKSLLVLLGAAILEAGGDALLRSGMQMGVSQKVVRFAAAALILFGYGYLVNSPPWDFGALLGVYVVFFFLVTQAMAWIFFDQRPGGPIILGGALIVAGGVIVSLGAVSK